MIREIFLIYPRGFCAGVDRAIDIVDICLKKYEHPIYVYHEIVHNRTVVERLKKDGAIFVDDLSQIPSGSVLVFSAHGVSPDLKQEADSRQLKVIIDATCPLVNKVHQEAILFYKQGKKIILIGHRDHDEVIGTIGEVSKDCIFLVESAQDVDKLNLDINDDIGVLTQTTLSEQDTRKIISIIKNKFHHVSFPMTKDICYATTNRQLAIEHASKFLDLLLVIGSNNSSNSQRLVDVAISYGLDAYLIDDTSKIKADEWIDANNKTSIGVTAGASAPEDIVQQVLSYLTHLSPQAVVKEFKYIENENVEFKLPKNLQE